MAGSSFLLLLAVFSALAVTGRAHAQVFVVGEKSATDELPVDFSPTRLKLTDEPLSLLGGRDLMRMMVGEQGFAHRALPLGGVLAMNANGALKMSTDEYKKLVYKKGEAVAAGDRVAITSMDIKPDRIVFDLNGGPYPPHRFLSHIQIDGMNLVANPGAQATGSRITLLFEGGVPEISAPELKVLLQPLLDFSAKTGEVAYAQTLPVPVKDAIEAHDVLVGMNHRMVLAALGQPESKMREHDAADPDGPRYEEWIYGHVPQTVKFVRFDGDRVNMVKVAAVGKPIEIRNRDELAGYLPPPLTREIALGDQKLGDEDRPVTAPSLRRPGDAPIEGDGQSNGRVQYPVEKTTKPAVSSGGSDKPQ